MRMAGGEREGREHQITIKRYRQEKNTRYKKKNRNHTCNGLTAISAQARVQIAPTLLNIELNNRSTTKECNLLPFLVTF